MHIITSEGRIEEGQPLTQQEANILADLNHRSGEFYQAFRTYIPEQYHRDGVLYLISNFNLTRRQQPAEPEPEIQTMRVVSVNPIVLEPITEAVPAVEAAPEAAKSDDCPF